MRAISMLFFGLLISCGRESDDKPVATVPQQNAPEVPVAPAAAAPSSFYVADAASLPACDASRQGHLVYIGAEKKLKACQDAAWIDLELPKGEKGDPGESASAKIAEQFLCAESDDLDPDANTIVKGRNALITKFGTGDYQIYCDDINWNTALGHADTASSSLFFSGEGKAVKGGAVRCATLNTVGEFNISAKSFAWSLNGTNPVASTCKQVFPEAE